MIHLPQQQISAWLDGQLEAAKAADVEAHLQQCETCRCFQEEMASTTRMFRDLEPLKMPAYLWTRVALELGQSPNRQRFAWLQWRGSWFFGRRELLGAAALCFISIGAVVALFEHRAAVRSEMAVIAQLDSVHNALVARDSDLYNPFRSSGWTRTDSNPFARRGLNADSNPFGSLREKR